jgi:hypothetical protein
MHVGIYTAADLADLGIPTEGIEMVMEDQHAVRGERGWVQGAGKNSENSQTPRFGLPEDP